MNENKLRVFHTADWHLGQRFSHFERGDEHQRFLDFLLQKIDEREPDILIIAGDIFDTTNPPQTAQQMYYDFLARLRRSPLRHVVVVAGNHDSPRLIEAPRELLRSLNIHVVGFAPPNPADCVLNLMDSRTQKHVATIAAVPFLRETDVRKTVAGENYREISRRIVEGITDYYVQIDRLLSETQSGIPVIATGHLFAQGLADNESEEIIHVGNQGKVPASVFPKQAAYVALGHIHRQQAVGGQQNIRYSGSPIALSFSEAGQKKCLIEIDFKSDSLDRINHIPIPQFRRLHRLRANSAVELAKKLESFSRDSELEDWIEVTLSRPPENTQWKIEMEDVAQAFGMLLISCPLETSETAFSLQDYEEGDLELTQLKPVDVLRSLYASKYGGDELPEEVLLTYQEALAEIESEALTTDKL